MSNVTGVIYFWHIWSKFNLKLMNIVLLILKVM
jgi:hypothetical protein